MKGDGFVNRKLRFQLSFFNEGSKNFCMMINFRFQTKIRIFIFENIVCMRVDSYNFLNIIFFKFLNVFCS